MKDGGPAFPRPGFRHDDAEMFVAGNIGMSLRDYFAGQALLGILYCKPHVVEGAFSLESVSRMSYVYADAMLKEREK